MTFLFIDESLVDVIFHGEGKVEKKKDKIFLSSFVHVFSVIFLFSSCGLRFSSNAIWAFGTAGRDP